MRNIAMGSASWKQAEDLFIAALDIPAGERDRFLKAACAGDTLLQHEVVSLLARDFDEQRLDAAIRNVAAGLAEDESLVGHRIGAYRLTAELGRGGMGVVYLAERDDQRFEKKVAIKLLTRGVDTPGARERLLSERRILANLDHPLIVKLLDGGETETGVPYIVMEYAEGRPLDQFAPGELPTAAACRLIQRVSDAVAYAHRNLVVHRDLKPSNILVSPSGEPRLLDFGIAGWLANGSATEPLRAFTPDYAAPEVLAGQAVTTAADVYSLGVLLRRLVPAPRADVAAILEKAVRPEPAERYPSAAELAADLQRLGAGFPVSARPSTALYRAAKFVRRHRWSVAASVLAVLGLAGATASALWQARRATQALAVAEVERRSALRHAQSAQQARQLAEQERATATRERDHALGETRLARLRLEQLIGLASGTVNGIHNTLEGMPGATEGRRKIVEQTLEFLNRTREQAGDDPELLRTVATGYLRMGMVLGMPMRPSLGETARAVEKFRQAEQIYSALLRRKPAGPSLRAEWIDCRRKLAISLAATGSVTEARRMAAETIARASQWTPPDDRVLLQLALAYNDLALSAHLSTGNPMDNERNVRRAVDLLEPLARRHPDDDSIQHGLAMVYSQQMEVVKSGGDIQGALRIGLRSAAIQDTLARRHPEDITFQRSLMLIYSKLSSLAGPSGMGPHLGDARQALEYARKMIGIAARIAQQDPANRTAQFDWAMAALRTGMIEPQASTLAESLAWLEQAAARLETLAKESPASAPYRLNLAAAYEYAGRRSEALGRPEAALAYAEKSLLAVRPMATPGATRAVYSQTLYSYRYLLHLGRDLQDEALQAAAAYQKDYPDLDPFFGRLWEAIGERHVRQGDAGKACAAFRRSVAEWSKVAPPGTGVNPAERTAAAARLSACGGERP